MNNLKSPAIRTMWGSFPTLSMESILATGWLIVIKAEYKMTERDKKMGTCQDLTSAFLVALYGGPVSRDSCSTMHMTKIVHISPVSLFVVS